jgi:hypothetical protein
VKGLARSFASRLTTDRHFWVGCRIANVYAGLRHALDVISMHVDLRFALPVAFLKRSKGLSNAGVRHYSPQVIDATGAKMP